MSPEWDNVILLSADALRADHLSCYGYDRGTTPELDKLAQESIRFENAYSASSHTREAVPALLTGRFPDVAVDDSYNLSTDTIASTLSQAGFATGGFHSNPYISRAYGFGRGFDEFDDDLHLGQHKLVALAQRALDKLRNRHYARAEEINERSLSWLDSLDDDQPFFLWNHYMDTHGPYEPPGEFSTMYGDQEQLGRDAQSLYRRALKDPESITNEEHERLIDSYDAEIRYNDAKIGEFLDELRERDLLDQSLLIVTADHGDAFGEHGYYGHPRFLHDEIVRVPLLIRRPRGAQEVVSTPASTLDIGATIEEEMEIVRREGRDGRSLFEMEEGERTVFMQVRGEDEDSHLRRFSFRAIDGKCFCERDLRDGAIQYQKCSDDRQRKRLKEHVQNRQDRKCGKEQTEPSDVNEEINRRLEALGYKE